MKQFCLEFLGARNIDDVMKKFLDTLIDTNRSYSFFVDWDKVKEHVEQYKVELNILNSLIGSRQFDDDLRVILSNYPQVLPVIPILLAIRELNFKVIEDFSTKDLHIVNYNFNVRVLTQKEIEDIVKFFEKTGLKKFFLELSTKSIQDYVIGVEVGLDTHARKNRSGNAMELLLEPIIKSIATKENGFSAVLLQKQFSILESNYGIKISQSIRNKKADFILTKNNGKVIDIEVNFFADAGSKPQEIVGSYIDRQNELKKNGFDFIWITDGSVWRGQENGLHRCLNELDYFLNLHFVRIGLLEEILRRV